jgi:2-methylcitrate dehydratase PrpD
LATRPESDPQSGTLASFAASLAALRFEQLTLSARQGAVRCILDAVGCAAAGRSTPVVSEVVRAAARWARSTFREGTATVWFEDATLSPSGAAYINSLATSVLDIDDGHRAASGHPGAAVIPAAITLGESIGASWQDILLAVVCGYEAGVRMAAARAPYPAYSGASGRWSAVAVAVVAGKLLKFDANTLGHAMALAEAHAPNMTAADHAGFAGSHAKEGIPWSVLVGLAAADQAALGLKGYVRALDNPAAYCGRVRGRDETEPFLIETTYFKPYASCRWTHSAVDAILELRRDGGLDPEVIESIEVASFRRALSLENLAQPGDIIAAQFSIPFVLAVALLEGPQALVPMSPDLLSRDDVRRLAQRVTLVLDPELEACFPAQVPARVSVHTRLGILQREIRTPLGDPRNPLADEALTDKAVRLSRALKSADEVRRFASALLSSSGSAGELGKVLAFLHPPAQDLS